MKICALILALASAALAGEKATVHAPDDLQPNDSEIAAICYISPAQLEREFAEHPEQYTPWFRQEWQELRSTYRERLERYCDLS